ncbi:unnamed protein product [Pieris macdunnoughi]|uniref:Asteroid domain-containing protein n=1 Tax=Pieris macdunnoughi TaxID=345717 RepID=A0A821WQU8_9NEOP|nr:unnamed protein product [Pieris macdunnoughi]
MKMKLVRAYLKKKSVGVFENRTDDSGIIIDGNYFKTTYMNSGCQFILGGEYDRYAAYLRKMLTSFTDIGVELYVIFSGSMKADVDKRKEIHQKLMNKTDSIQPGRQENEYCEPTFTKDVQREVFDKLGIRYFVCECNHSEALISLAIDYNLPILTNNFEYCLFGVTCILPNSIVFDDNGFRCTVYKPNRQLFPLSIDMMSILLAISDEDSSYYQHIPGILKCHEKLIFLSAQHWIRKQNKKSAIETLTKYLKPSDKQELLETISYMEKLFKHSRHFVASSYRNRHAVHPTRIDTTSKDWFETAVARGLIAIPYINLKNNNSCSGSWLIVDKNRDDAMLVALDLIFYALGLLTNSTDLKISFIGRQSSLSIVRDIEKKLPTRKALYMFRSSSDLCSAELFRVIINELMNGFDFVTLDSISKDCHMIIIALVYYSRKNKDFQNGVYSILLSYFMLGPIGNKVGVLKKSNFAVTHSTGDKTKDRYVTAANAFIDLFYLDGSRLKTIFNRDILHNIAEFEHCLQHVNFLNKLCGEVTMCTIYHKAVNTTFVHNLYFTLTQEKNPLEYLKTRFNCDSIYLEYENLIRVFEKCAHSVK